jgi:hypothetical protein
MPPIDSRIGQPNTRMRQLHPGVVGSPLPFREASDYGTAFDAVTPSQSSLRNG